MISLVPKMAFLLEGASRWGPEIHRVFGLDQQTLFQIMVLLINVAILAFFLSKFLYKPVRQMLYDRTDRIRNQLRNADEENKAANALKAQYEAKIKDIQIEREQILDAARKEAAERGKQILDEAKTEADTIRDRAMRNVEMEQERVKDEMRQSIIELSGVMAQKFVARSMDQGTRDTLFDEVMAELKDVDFKASARVAAG
jgi:F-type H+-transporting ATPase subunit b